MADRVDEDEEDAKTVHVREGWEALADREWPQQMLLDAEQSRKEQQNERKKEQMRERSEKGTQ